MQVENKFKQEMEEHKQRLDKEYEALMQSFARELEQLREKHNKEIEKRVRNVCKSYAKLEVLCY